MKISTKGRYALAIMLDLAMNNPEEYISLKDIATRQEISIKYLERIGERVNIINVAEIVGCHPSIHKGFFKIFSHSSYEIIFLLFVVIAIKF